MSRETVIALQGPFEHSWGLLNAYMDVCPDHVWSERNGGWPIWQQMAHALAVVDFFIKGKADFLPMPCDLDTLMLKTQGCDVVDKPAMRAYALTVKARADSWWAGLADADLPVTDAVISGILGRPVSAAAVAVMLSSHSQYHLGSCDAALRDHNLPGVF